MVEYLYKSLVDFGKPTVEVLLDVLEIGHGSRIFPQPVSVFFQKGLARLLGDSDVPQPLGVVGRNNADPPHIIEFNIGDDVLILLVFAPPQHSRNSTTRDASKTAVSSALLEATVLRLLSMLSMQSDLTLPFLRMDVAGHLEVLLHLKINIVLSFSGVPDPVVPSPLHLSCKL